MPRPRLLTCALITTLASCASTAPRTRPGPIAEVPVFASDDERVGTAGFVSQTLRLRHQQDGATYTLMAFGVGDTLTLGAMVKGDFAGNVHWHINEDRLAAAFDTGSPQAEAPVHNTRDRGADLVGQGAAFRGTAWINIDMPLNEWITNGSALQLRFVANDGAVVTLPDEGHHYVVQRKPQS